MKFRCERDVLVDVLTTAGRAAKGSAMPVLAGVRLEVTGDRLHLAATDLDLSIQVATTVAGLEDGVCVVPAKLSADIVRSLEPGAVSVEAEDDEVRISSGRSQFAVRMLPVADFPRLPVPAASSVTLPQAEFLDALRQVVRAACTDEAVPVLTGVLMAAEEGGLRLVATDRYRLAMRDLPGVSILAEGQKVLVPSRALAEVQRLLSSNAAAGSGVDGVTLRLGERDATFEVGPVQLTTRLIEGEFPNYRQLIPSSYPNRLVVGRDGLLDAVKRVKLLVRDAITPVRITMRADGIELNVVTQEVGQASDDVDAKYEGTDMTIAFNPGYLIDGIEAVGGDEVILETVDGVRPATVRSTDSAAAGEFLYLLMPVRVS